MTSGFLQARRSVTRIHEAELLSPIPTAGRECGDCTACCTVLAIVELQKPQRRACDHLCRSGCGIYATRPASCREFHCLWLRGALDADEALRPDRLGVMFDYFVVASSGESHLIAIELWPGALAGSLVQSLLAELTQTRDVHLSYRDGRRSTLQLEATPNSSPSIPTIAP